MTLDDVTTVHMLDALGPAQRFTKPLPEGMGAGDPMSPTDLAKALGIEG